MENILYATITADGFIADVKGEENIFSDDNWELFVKLAHKYQNVIWGRKTYDMVCSWPPEYIKDFDDLNIIVISHTNDMTRRRSNVTFVSTPKEAIDVLRNLNINTPFISGGSSIYSEFLKNNLVDKIILGLNSTFISNGIKIFNQDFETKYFKFVKAEKIKDNILYIEMKKTIE